MKPFIDIHTHRANRPFSVYQQLLVDNSNTPIIDPNQLFSIGIHPQQANHTSLLPTLYSQSKLPHCIAIGEAGLDRLVDIDMPTQLACFEAQITWAMQVNKPLMVHCVKAFDMLLALLKKYPTHTPWVIHGFRGNPALAKQLYDKGCYLSVGQYFNAQSVAKIPIELLLLETDESTKPIEQIYQQVADAKQISIQSLQEAVFANAQRLFGTIFNVYLV